MQKFTLLLLAVGSALHADGSLVDLTENSDAAAVRRAIASGADTNLYNSRGQTALMIAAKNNLVEIVEVLIKAGAQIDLQDKYDRETALGFAASSGALEAARLLVAAKANLNLRNKYDMTPLMRVLHREKYDVRHGEFALLLIGSGADVNAVADNGVTCLMYAIIHSDQVTRALLAARADVNARTKWGETALMRAAAQGYESRVKLLLNAKADPNIVNNKGQSALAMARAAQRKDIEKILVNGGAR